MEDTKKTPRLAEYAAKRDFTVTPEPAPRDDGSAVSSPEGLVFMVHKHHARALHYDLRLEIDGALASWAIPKGPSYDPKSKRLAVQTEDHPLEYATFEGRIPDDEYGSGDSLIWDRGTYDTVPPGEAAAQRERGRLKVQLSGEKLKGRWNVIRTGPPREKAQWLFFKAKDEHADPTYDVVAARPESVASGRVHARGPVMARVRKAKHPAPAALLDKTLPPRVLDRAPAGIRAIGAISGGAVAMWADGDVDLAPRFPGILRALEQVKVPEAVIDGEIIADGGVLSAFDLLWLDGEDLRGRPSAERRDLLASVLDNAPDEIRLAEPPDRSGRAG